MYHILNSDISNKHHWNVKHLGEDFDGGHNLFSPENYVYQKYLLSIKCFKFMKETNKDIFFEFVPFGKLDLKSK